MRLRLIHPPPARSRGFWLASCAFALAMHGWLRRLDPAAGALAASGSPHVLLGPAQALLPPLLLAWLLFHPRTHGLWRWRRGQESRKRLGLSFVDPAEAGRLRRAQARGFIAARVGPAWARCGVAGIVVAGWMASLGWLDMAPSPRYRHAGPWLLRRPDAVLAIVAAGAAACFFASHVFSWERAALTARRASRLEVFGAFWRGAGWSAISQAWAALFGLAFGGLLLLFGGSIWIGFAAVGDLAVPDWLRYVLDGRRPRPELLLLVLPGMAAQAIRDGLALRRDLEARLSMLALEVARERGRGDKEGTRRRVAAGRQAD